MWANAEEKKGNIGDYSQKESAAWIIKKACTDSRINRDHISWKRWIQFAQQHPDISEQYTPLFIIRKACFDFSNQDASLWKLWAIIEEENKNIGKYSQWGTAAWIYKAAVDYKISKGTDFWINWVHFIEKHALNIPIDENRSVLSYLKEGCLNNQLPVVAWITWAKQAEVMGIIGDYNLSYTASWIYKQCCTENIQTDNSGALFYYYWAKFAHRHPQKDGINLITAEFIFDLASQKYPNIYTNPTWEGLTRLFDKD